MLQGVATQTLPAHLVPDFGLLLVVAIALCMRGAASGVVLAALIGWRWTLVVIGLSAVVAIVTGVIVDALVGRGAVRANPHRTEVPDDFRFWPEAKHRLRGVRFSWAGIGRGLRAGLVESRMVLRWIFFGAILAATIRGRPTNSRDAGTP